LELNLECDDQELKAVVFVYVYMCWLLVAVVV